MNGVTKAISLVGLCELARRCHVTHQAVRKWERGRVPFERILDIERATGGRVTREELRPDFFSQAARANGDMAPGTAA